MQGTADPNRPLMDAGALVGHLVRPGTVYALLAEHRHRLFPDELFADLFPSGRGRPSVPADVIATVMVLQALVGQSDRDAVEALRSDLRTTGRERIPACAWDDPADIERVVTELVWDAVELIIGCENFELSEEHPDAVGMLGLVAQRDVEPGDEPGTWRIARRTAPDRMVSVHDPESRHVHKTTSNYRDGLKGPPRGRTGHRDHHRRRVPPAPQTAGRSPDQNHPSEPVEAVSADPRRPSRPADRTHPTSAADGDHDHPPTTTALRTDQQPAKTDCSAVT